MTTNSFCRHGIEGECIFCAPKKLCKRCDHEMAVEVGSDTPMHYTCSHCEKERWRIEALEKVYAEAKYLRDSGYDGQFIGQPIEGLFKAIADAEVWMR